MEEIIFLEKNFKRGDIIIATSSRNGLSMGIARDLWVHKFDHDVDFDEAAKIHLYIMKKDYPGMFKDWTIDRMKETFDKNDKYYVDNRGEIKSYTNHEVADEFDKLYIEDKIELSELSRLKDKYVREFNVQSSKYPGDEFSEYRIFDDITEWINENLKI